MIGQSPGVLTGISKRVRKGNRLNVDLKGTPLGEPDWPIRPMLLTLLDEPFDRKGWIFEVKWDGL